jgi:DNA-binding transcriptional ArsR family regulator
MREFVNLTKALADTTRVRILLALHDGELCVCQITELFGFAPSTVSKHLSILQQAGLILSRKTERWVYYRLPGAAASVAARAALNLVQQCAGKSAEAMADRKQLKKILQTEPAVLCRRQRCC